MRKGFTLLELLIIIVILGVLTTLIMGNFFTSLKKGRDAQRKGDLEQIQRSLEMYYEDKKAYPLTAAFDLTHGYSFCESAVRQNCLATEKAYMLKLPRDPSGGQSYGYESADGTYYKLYACLENSQQVLPYTSNPTAFNCQQQCFDKDNNSVKCIWGVSSPNVSP